MSIIISPDKTISVEGENYNFHSGNLVYDYTNLPFTNLENNVFKFENGLVLATNCEKSQHTAVIKHNNVIKNTSSNPITLNKAASLAVCGIAENANLSILIALTEDTTLSLGHIRRSPRHIQMVEGNESVLNIDT